MILLSLWIGVSKRSSLVYNSERILPVHTGYTESLNHPKGQAWFVESPYDGHSAKPGWCFCSLLKVRSCYQSSWFMQSHFSDHRIMVPFGETGLIWWSCREATQSGTRRTLYLHARWPSCLRASVSDQDVVDHLSIYGWYLEIVSMAIENHCFVLQYMAPK